MLIGYASTTDTTSFPLFCTPRLPACLVRLADAPHPRRRARTRMALRMAALDGGGGDGGAEPLLLALEPLVWRRQVR